MNNQFNCAQSVFAVFADDLGLPRDTALKIAACFGGGMRCGETCGAVTGALMALGLKYGSCKENDPEGKRAAYMRSLEFIRRFKEARGTITCKELLGYNPGDPEDAKEISRLGLHESVCNKLVAEAAGFAEDIINNDIK